MFRPGPAHSSAAADAKVTAGRSLKGPDLPENLAGLNASVSRQAEQYLEAGTGS